MARKRKETLPPPKRPKFNLNPELWKQVVAIGLLALAVVILLSLLTSSRGPVTEGLIEGIRFLVGWGVLLAPLWLAATGIYLLLDSINKIPNIGIERPIGAGLLYLVALALIHLIAQQALAVRNGDFVRNSGGLLGALLGDVLTGAVGDVGAYIVLLALAGVGVTFLLHLSLGDIVGAVALLVARGRGQEFIPGVRINTPQSRSLNPAPFIPSLPMPKPEPPNGKRAKGGPESDLLPPLPRVKAERKPAVVIGRVDEPTPPLPPMKARIIGEVKHE
ncbi:MAG: DNA translocase FtsK 4TM domain-containing protein, partial [Chloroflexi bacterium]|nr:DNA translocase FtsK 4TM domain-containing protein [Chloroflexota bacterium]